LPSASIWIRGSYPVDPPPVAWHLALTYMKRHLLIFGSCALVLASCQTGEVVSSGSFDPLVAPGSGRTPVSSRADYKPGSFVRTNMDNVAFFSKRPQGDMSAEKQLAGNTEMKVISDDGTYVKGELNSGEVGFVLSIQVTDQSSALPAVGSVNEFQVYPPPPGGVIPLPVDGEVPTIPPVIDPTIPEVPATPDAPSLEDPSVPPASPDATPAPAPAAPPQSTPLPPGNEAEPKVE
jgi:hypothetical protein